MKSLLLIVSLVFMSLGSLCAQNEYSKIRISLAEHSLNELISYGLDIDHGVSHSGTMIECIASKHAITLLQNHGVTVEILVHDMEAYYESRLKKEFASYKKSLSLSHTLTPKNFVSGSMGGYYTLEEIFQQMDRLRAYAPEIVSLPDTIGITGENRPIIAWHFSLSTDTTVPSTLFTSLHHAREPGGATTMIYFLWDIVEKAKNNSSEIMYLLSNHSFTYVPCVNPDGYAFNQSQKPNGGGLWRKNRRKINADASGVDLNRNYGPFTFWDANNGGSSTDPKSDLYRGEAPFSEPETQAIQSLMTKHKYNCILNYHTYSNLLIYPFAAKSAETPDSLAFRGFAADIAKYNRYSAGRDLETVGYTTRGNSDDWAYDLNGALAFTPEVGAFNDGFWPSPNRIIDHAKENIHMNYQALWSAGDNICLREATIETDSLYEKGGSITLDFQNIGRLNTPEFTSITIQSLNDKVIILDSIFTLPLMKSGEHILRNIAYTLMNNYRNGDTTTFILSTTQHGVIRSDTLHFPLYKPEVLPVFTNIADSSNLILGSWGIQYASQSKEYTITDSPKGLYPPEYDSYCETSKTYDLTAFNAAYLRANCTWSIEPLTDFGIVQISKDDGRTWDYLQSSRMNKGKGINGGKQSITGYGFEGNFPDWEYQVFNISSYKGKKVRFRFGLLSDQGAEFDGFSLKDIKVFGYRDSMSDVHEISPAQSLQADIFPVPNNGSLIYLALSYPNAQLKSTRCFITVFNAIGQSVQEFDALINPGNEALIEIPVQGFASGTYSVRIITENQEIATQSFIIQR